MICIYHNRDFDGICSAAIIREQFTNCKFIGWDYGDPIPEIKDDEDVMIVDISFDMKIMYEIAKKVNNFVWIDHHISAINDWKKFNKEVNQFPKTVTVRLNPVFSACELTWQYFNTEAIPTIAKLLGRYDVWDQSDLYTWDDEIYPFQLGMKSICNSLDSFPFHFNEDYYIIQEVIRKGNVIRQYHQYLDEYKCRSTSFEIEFEGYKAICINENIPGLNVFNSVWNEDKYDIMILFVYTGSSWRVSLYTTKDIDVSEICKKYGGGGHKKAAGFRIGDIHKIIKKEKEDLGYYKILAETSPHKGEVCKCIKVDYDGNPRGWYTLINDKGVELLFSGTELSKINK